MASLEVNAVLAAKKAAREVAQRMSLPGDLPPPSPMGFGASPAGPPGGMQAPPSPMGMGQPAAAPMGMGAPMMGAPPPIPDPASDPSIPPPTAPMASMAATGAASPPPGAAATPRYAAGGVVGSPTLTGSTLTAEEMAEIVARLAQGEPVNPNDYVKMPNIGSTDQTDMPIAGAESAVAPRNGVNPSLTPDVPEKALPAPPQRFLDWLESPEATSGIGQEIRAAYEEDPASAPVLWQLLKDFVDAPDDDETDDLPPDLLRVVKGKKVVPPAEPVRLSGERKVALPV